MNSICKKYLSYDLQIYIKYTKQPSFSENLTKKIIPAPRFIVRISEPGLIFLWGVDFTS